MRCKSEESLLTHHHSQKTRETARGNQERLDCSERGPAAQGGAGSGCPSRQGGKLRVGRRAAGGASGSAARRASSPPYLWALWSSRRRGPRRAGGLRGGCRRSPATTAAAAASPSAPPCLPARRQRRGGRPQPSLGRMLLLPLEVARHPVAPSKRYSRTTTPQGRADRAASG